MKFKELQQTFDTYRLYKDRGVVRILAASVIANQLLGKKRKPVWIIFVAPPGGGKSDITGTVTGIEKTFHNQDGDKVTVKLCEEISDLTPASFASGMNTGAGETSLLMKLHKEGGMMVFKDFTTLLSKRSEDLAAIMSYLREVYDGKFDKAFGNGKKVSWEGKAGVIASCTTVIYHKLPELSVMGDRFMMYQIEQPDRLAVQEKIWENEDAGIDGEEEMANAMKQYLEMVMKYVDDNKGMIDAIKIDAEQRKEFGEVANFITYARSGVVWNFKKDTISYVPDAEMPTRVLRQLITMAQALIVMNMAEGFKPVLTDNDKKYIYKLAFDSIPGTRRSVIKLVAKYAHGSTMDGISEKIGMQRNAVEVWIEELIAVGIMEKNYNHGTKKYMYKIKDEHMSIIQRYEHIDTVEEMLVAENDDPESEWAGSGF